MALSLAGEDGRIGGFVEEAIPLGEAVTDLANTGIYIVSPRALSMIPQGEEHRFCQRTCSLLCCGRGWPYTPIGTWGY